MDWDKIEQLLNIADKAKNWPNLKKIHDGAMEALMVHAEPPAPKLVSKKEVKDE